MGKKETMVDTAKVLGRFFDGIEYRGYDQKVVEGLAANAGVPVWNGLTDVDHPTQALADILTLMENTKKPLNKCKLVFSIRVRMSEHPVHPTFSPKQTSKFKTYSFTTT
jgi:ornithine carbamoyltransferase